MSFIALYHKFTYHEEHQNDIFRCTLEEQQHSLTTHYDAELCTAAVLPWTLTMPSSRLNRNSPTYLQMYTSSLPYLPHICEDF